MPRIVFRRGNPLFLIWVVYVTGIHTTAKAEVEPVFAEPIPNITVALGRDAKLPCVVDHLGSYRNPLESTEYIPRDQQVASLIRNKVAWLRVESKTILSIHNHIITRNYRISMTQNDHRTWILNINNVQESDRGGYMCQINTEPMKSQVGYMDVAVPPDILGNESSSDVIVREGSNVTLACRARGYPNPKITWRRENGQAISVGNWQNNKIQELSFEGEHLVITKVSRLHMGAYLCIASNGVPPSVSRRIMLQVHFPPMIWIPNQLVGAPMASEVTLDCNTEASPTSVNYWAKEDTDMLLPSDKYNMSVEDKSYRVHMSLTIRNVEPQDFGVYKCFAKNSLGSTEGSIRLYEIHVSPQPAREPATAKIHSLSDIDSSSASTVYVKEYRVWLAFTLILWGLTILGT